MQKREIFADALAITEPSARRRFIAEACAGDRELQAEIEDLLSWHERAPALVDDGATAVADVALPPPSTSSRDDDMLPPELPGIAYVRLVGVGGAGRVYEAWQEAPRRRVAVKLLRTALDGPAATRRLFREAEILARLDHPGIARVHAVHAVRWAGVTVPAIVMELVEGGMPLTDWAADGSVPVRRRVEVFAAVCDAVGHAHRLGIIHRDLKPGNILVDRAGRPKVIDFDWARSTDGALGVDSLGTRSGQLIGTHAYMSPEQFEGGMRSDSRSDVWALGMVLFELLAGRPALDLRGKTVYDAAATVRDAPLPPVTRFAAGLPRDLAAIVATCLDRRPERRYADAGALAADLERHRAGAPVLACPPGFVDGVLQLAGRHRAAAAATATVLGSLVAATVGIALFAGRAEQDRVAAERARMAERVALDAARAARDRAERAAREAMAGEYVANVRHLAHPRETVKPSAVGELFDTTARLARDLGIGSAGAVPLELAVLHSGFDDASDRVGIPEEITTLAWSPGGETVAVGGAGGGVFVVDAGNPGEPRRIDAHSSKLTALGFSPDGRWLATAASDGAIRIHDIASGESSIELPQQAKRVGAVAFAPTGALLATAGDDGNLRLFDADTGRPRHTLRYRRGALRTLAFRPGDGATIATGSPEGDSVLWDARDGTRLAAFGSRRTRSAAIAYSPDGALLAVPDDGDGVAIVDGLTGTRLHHLAGPDLPVTGLAFSPDGHLLAVVYGDAPVHVWDPVAARRVALVDGHRSAVIDAAFSPDGRWLATVSSDRVVRIEDPLTGRGGVALRGHETKVAHVAWSPTGARLATASGSVVRFWDDVAAGGPRVLRGPGAPARRVAFSADGRTLVVAWHGSVAAWDVATATQRTVLSHPARDGSFFALSGATTPHAGLVAAPVGEAGIGVWSIDGGDGGDAEGFPGRPRPHPAAEHGAHGLRGRAPRALAFMPADGRLLIACGDGEARLADPVTGAGAATARLVPDLLCAAVSGDGTTVIGGGNGGDIAVWHPPAEAVLRPAGHEGKVRALVFRPGQRQFVSVGQDGRVVLRDQGTGDVVREVAREQEWITGVAFSPDGTRLALATISGRLSIRAIADDVPAIQAGGHDQRVNTIAWSPDGTRLVTGSEDHTVRIWDAATGLQLADFDSHSAPVLDVAISPDGRIVASASADGTVRLWGRSNAEILAARRAAGR